jgi:predicted Co/Zn/Cd cation transporter (cation efflux family)
MNDSHLVEEKALKKSMIGAFLLAVWGIVMASLSHSGAILLDGMFNLISAIMSFFSIEITRLIAGKETREFPLGYFALESLFVFVKGASILILVLMALYSNIQVLLSGGREPALGLMTVYVAIAVIGCLVLYGVTKKSSKQTGSEILEAETKAWFINAVITGIIGVAFAATLVLRNTALGWIDRYIDQVLVIIFSLIFIKDPLLLMKNGIKELLLAAPQDEYTEPYEKKILPLKEQFGLNSMALEIIKTGRRIWLTVFVDPNSATVNIDEFMQMKSSIESMAKEVYENTQTEIILKRA